MIGTVNLTISQKKNLEPILTRNYVQCAQAAAFATRWLSKEAHQGSCLIGNAVVKIHGVERASSKSIGYFSLRRPYHILNYSVPLGKAWLNVAEVHLKCQHKLSVDNSHITFWPIPTPNFWEFARDPAIPKLKRIGEWRTRTSSLSWITVQ